MWSFRGLITALCIASTILPFPNVQVVQAWLPVAPTQLTMQRTVRPFKSVLFESKNSDPPDEDARTTFDQAGASLIEEEDQKRMEQMGDFDANPSYKNDSIEKMREAIRARTADLGIEKSKVSADYIEAKQQRAMQAGSAAAASEDSNSFGGLDLSKISYDKNDGGSKGQPLWDEDMPTMFYDPEAELTVEEREEIDPIMKKNPVSQGLEELSNAEWPTFGAAGREVVLMVVVVAFSCLVIIGWDKILRYFYTSLGFIPTPEDLKNYASRFDGLDLPSGWMNNMNEQDVAKFAEKVNTALPTSSSSLPEL